MPDSIDIAPTKGPLSSEYRQWVFNIAKDIAQFNRLRPFLEQAAKDILGESPQRIDTFPARINGSMGAGKTAEPCMYSFLELSHPFDKTKILDGGRMGLATNTMEVDITCKNSPHHDSQDETDIYLPPGFLAGETQSILTTCVQKDPCYAEFVWPHNRIPSPLGPDDTIEFYDYECLPVGWPNGTIVPMHEEIATEEINLANCGTINPGEPFYYFTVAVPVCVSCYARNHDNYCGPFDDDPPPSPLEDADIPTPDSAIKPEEVKRYE